MPPPRRRVQSAVMTRISHSQQSTRRDCQVLVVGAGPTGLVLACELLARGIRARIIDKGDGVLLQTRALGVHARTLEVFDMMGLAERFVEQGQVVRRFHMLHHRGVVNNARLYTARLGLGRGSVFLRACPETQVGCSWCDWLYLARRRVMTMVIAQ